VRASVVSPNIYRYSLFEEYDKAIEHMSRGIESPSVCNSRTVSRGPYLCDYYLAKAAAAAEYQRYEVALQAFSAAEENIEKEDRGRRCQLYTARRDLHAKMKNFDAALAEVNKMNSPLIKWACGDESYRVRADAAFEKGDWRAAIDNYTRALNTNDPGELGRLNLVRSYLNLGDAQGALTEINRYCGIVCSGEFLRLQARAYLLNGQTALADAKMKSFAVFQAYVKNEQILKANSRIVYGSMKAPPGMALGKGILIVAVVDPVTGSFIRQCPTDNLQRFSTRYWRRRPFRVRATYEEKIDGRLLRFSGETKNLVIRDDNIGPLLIELRPSS